MPGRLRASPAGGSRRNRRTVIDERGQPLAGRFEHGLPALGQAAHPVFEGGHHDLSWRPVTERGEDRGEEIRYVAAEQVAPARRRARQKRIKYVEHFRALERDPASPGRARGYASFEQVFQGLVRTDEVRRRGDAGGGGPGCSVRPGSSIRWAKTHAPR